MLRLKKYLISLIRNKQAISPGMNFSNGFPPPSSSIPPRHVSVNIFLKTESLLGTKLQIGAFKAKQPVALQREVVDKLPTTHFYHPQGVGLGQLWEDTTTHTLVVPLLRPPTPQAAESSCGRSPIIRFPFFSKRCFCSLCRASCCCCCSCSGKKKNSESAWIGEAAVAKVQARLAVEEITGCGGARISSAALFDVTIAGKIEE